MVQKKHVDLVLMDIRMPELDGIHAAQAIRKISPESKIVMLTSYNDVDYAKEALASDVSGYILKDTAADELVATIKQIQSGRVVFSRGVLSGVFSDSPAEEESSVDRDFLDELTPREMSILRMMAEGLTNAETADSIYLR